MSLNVLQKFIECLKEQNPDLDDLDILIALRASGLRGSEIYCISPQLATKYQRLKEVDASANVSGQEASRGETERSKDWSWWINKNPLNTSISIEQEDTQN